MAAAPAAAPGGGFPSAKSCSGHGLASPLLGASTEPVYCHRDARGAGHMYFWETRRWLSFFNVKDARETKKMQHRHGIWSAVCAEWNLPLQQHYSHSVVNGWNTSMCSSKGLVAWLFGNVGSFQRGRSCYGSRQSSVALHNIYEMAENGYNESDEATRDSSMVLPGGVMVQIGACGMLSTPLWGHQAEMAFGGSRPAASRNSVQVNSLQVGALPRLRDFAVEQPHHCHVLARAGQRLRYASYASCAVGTARTHHHVLRVGRFSAIGLTVCPS